MSDLSILSGAAVTMSSREIAELTGKDHAHVMRDTRNMLEVLKKDASSFGGIYQDAYGRDKPCFNLDRELTMTLVSGYDIPLRHRVVTKLAELEAQALRPPAALPDFTNPAAAARAWADAIEQKQAVEVEAQKMTHQLALVAPKAQALDRISASEGNITLTQAAKLLGLKRDTLTHWLHTSGWIYRQNGSWVAYDAQIRSGRLAYKEAKYTDEGTGQEMHKPYCHLTPKGLAWLAENGPVKQRA
jgi:phage antirepressor YoqD-like protein